MDNCIKCQWRVRVNYSCYESNRWDVYVCNDCESHYWMEEIAKELAYESWLILDY